jgi:hypothetical protein
MQRGGDAEKISINDPRYPELYKNRQVGAYYDGAYSLPDLDEVTVTAPRSYTMDSLRNFTTAALYGAPANAMKVSMIPQAAMTEGIEALRGEPYDFSNVNPNFGGFTSNQRDLSQTMGYENPEGFLQNVANIGLSMIDPLNVVGVGAIDDVAKASLNAIPKASFKSSISNTKSNLLNAVKGTGSFFDEVLGELLAGKENRESIRKGNEWLQNWINDSVTQQKIDKDINKYIQLRPPLEYENLVKPVADNYSVEDLLRITNNNATINQNKINDPLIRYQSKNFKPDSKEYSLYKQLNENLGNYLNIINPKSRLTPKSIHSGNLGVSYAHNVNPQTRELYDINVLDPFDRYGSWISRHPLISQPKRFSTTIHEGTHDWVSADAFRKSGMRNVGLKNINPDAKKALLDIEAGLRNQLTKEQQDLGYLADPTEQHARIMELRAHFGLEPRDVIDDDVAKKIIEKIKNKETPITPKFLKVIDSDPSKLAERFNRFWAVPAVGVAVGAQVADQQKNGGITKDNQGYWNPDNWGKPVEVDSNDITMEGVYEPLLGVSDTGDTKLMKPGKNYKFKGKKVREYPVAKLGINQLDAQPMKKLNQLLNFTNNPDKDNWLDKYN